MGWNQKQNIKRTPEAIHRSGNRNNVKEKDGDDGDGVVENNDDIVGIGDKKPKLRIKKPKAQLCLGYKNPKTKTKILGRK
nr:hypothetical protein [Leptospira bandrabouensis]